MAPIFGQLQTQLFWQDWLMHLLRGTDRIGRIAATEVSGIQGRQTGFPSTKPARVFDIICEINDAGLFNAIMDDRNHVLNHLLPPVKHGVCNLRQRNHNRIIPGIKDSFFP